MLGSLRATTALGLFALSVSTALCADPVTVVKVRILIGDLRYDWSAPSSIPDRLPGGFTAPSTVASFLGIAPGDQVPEEELERRRHAAEERLGDCGFFSAVDVSVVRAASRADGRLVVVRLSEGFLWRFGGGPLYATVGKVNVFGERKGWELAAGANCAKALWKDDSVLGLPFGYRAELGYRSSQFTGYDGFLDYHLVEAKTDIGVRPTPDVLLSLEWLLRYRWLRPRSPGLASYPSTSEGWEWLPQAGFQWSGSIWPGPFRLTAKTEGSVGISVLAVDHACTLVSASNSITLEHTCHTASGNRTDGPALGLQLSYGSTRVVNGGLSAFALFDLYDAPDRSVRSGYDFQQLLAASFILVNSEVRLPFPPLELGSLFSIVVAPFVYADAALASGVAAQAPSYFQAVGAGIRFLFDNPIFAYFTFSYGWNPEGGSRFCFSATSGF